MSGLTEVLESLGYIVRRRGKESFDVVLPLWCSVRVQVTGGNLKLQPRFGLVSRTVGTWLNFLGALGALVSAWILGDRAFLAIGVLVIASVVWDVYRYSMTEQAMSVVRYVHWSIGVVGVSGGTGGRGVYEAAGYEREEQE